MKSVMKAFSILMVLVLAVFASASVRADNNFGATPGIDVLYVKVNGDTVSNNQTIQTEFQRNNNLSVEVKLQSQDNATMQDVEVSAFIDGYEFNSNPNERLSDATEPFAVMPNVVYTKNLQLSLPGIMQNDSYKLRVVVADRYSSLNVYNYNLLVDSVAHAIQIKDVTLTPSDTVQAGKSLLAVVRLKNVGADTEQDVRVNVAIPDLGVSATGYINSIDPDTSKSSEELYLRLPIDAAKGIYGVVTTVTYNNDHSDATRTDNINVLASPVQPQTSNNTPQTTAGTQPATTVVSADTNTKVVSQGEGGAIYPITITNQGLTAQSYTLSVDGVDWATTRWSPSNLVVVNPGESKAVYLYVSANEGTSVGERMFSVAVNSGNTVLQQIPLKADVIESQAAASQTDVKTVLEYVLLVLIAVLVVVAIVVAVRKAKGKNEGGETAEDLTQTYY